MLSSATNLAKFRQNIKFLVCTKQNSAIIWRHGSNKDYSSSDEEDNKSKPKNQVKKSKALEGTAVNRLNQLLASMSTNTSGDLVKVIDLKKVGSKKQKIKAEREQKKIDNPDNTKNVIEAAKSVAKALGGDVKQTESELLSKLLLHSDNKENIDAAREAPSKTPISLSELMVGMKIDKTTKPTDELQTKADYIRRAMKRTGGGSLPVDGQFRKDKREAYDKSRRPHRVQPLTGMTSVNLFGSEPLGIFKDPAKLQESPDLLETWNKLKNRELKMAVTHPPANYFEKMILWTEQGKVWKFPIDNEQGLDVERNVYFADHIFLEEHLEGWCPTRGPVRHFMELVCVGLSKNPYITVQAKKDHIMWFKNYFEEKQDILKAVIVDDKEIPKELSQ